MNAYEGKLPEGRRGIEFTTNILPDSGCRPDFQKGYDDLDYLEYARLEIMPDRTVALISHENTPIPGTDIYVAPDRLDIVKILINTIAAGTLR